MYNHAVSDLIQISESAENINPIVRWSVESDRWDSSDVKEDA